MRSVVTQTEARRRRQRLEFCYLCGRTLSVEGLSREHIVPRSVLGDPPSSSAWPMLLSVHQRCERDQKRESDARFALWQRLFLSPEDKVKKASDAFDTVLQRIDPRDFDSRNALSLATERFTTQVADAKSRPEATGAINAAFDRYLDDLTAIGAGANSKTKTARTHIAALLTPIRELLTMGHYRRTPFKPVADVMVEEDVIALDGFSDIMAAVWNWIRGFHAAVYETFLPTSVPHAVLSSLPAFSGTIDPEPFVNPRVHRTILRTLELASRAGKLDRLQFWGGLCDFRCAWVQLPESRAFARGAWRLALPGPEGTRSWWGWYDLPAPPENCALLEAGDFETPDTQAT